jgi:hypothetical protein
MIDPRAHARVGAPSGRVGLCAALAAGIVLLGAVALPGRIALHQCMSSGGGLGSVGLRLALLRTAADCPDGTVAVTPLAHGGVVVLLSIALPLLLAHVALGAGGVGLTTVLVRALRSAARVLAGALLRVPHAPGAVVVRVTRLPASTRVDGRWTLADVLAAHPHRGPPSLPA